MEQATVYADPAQFEQVIYNLVVNARDAMAPGGGAVRLLGGLSVVTAAIPHRYGSIAPGEYVTVTIEDSGTGMREEVLAHLFEPFYTTKSQGRGTGLGLATIYGIVPQAHGSITTYSEPGLGSQFTVLLAQGPGPGSTLPTPPAPLIRGPKREIGKQTGKQETDRVQGHQIVRHAASGLAGPA